jgi:hypothetical protein
LTGWCARRWLGDLADRTEVLYVSPLKALGNDIQKNLEGPLGEILALAGERGLLMPEIRTAVRTGDTLQPERRAMLKRPPHILVTTPESLYILLTADKSRAILRDVETVIVDEIHAVADDKRGAHLALSLERLEALCHRPPVRIGLSATQKPIEEVAHFLTGSGRADPVIVDIGHKRKLDLGWKFRRCRWGRWRRMNVGRDLRPAGGAGERAPVDAGVCEYAAHGGALVRTTGRAHGRGKCGGASWLACRASCAWRPRRN